MMAKMISRATGIMRRRANNDTTTRRLSVVSCHEYDMRRPTIKHDAPMLTTTNSNDKGKTIILSCRIIASPASIVSVYIAPLLQVLFVVG
jgi:hypothetical protein